MESLEYKDVSLGTQRFFSLLGAILVRIKSGMLLIDEIETSMHPYMVSRLIEIFFNETEGKQNFGQLIFTTHNPLLLDQNLLRRDQIWFTEKNDEGATRLYPLTDFSPRNDESLVKGYLSGRYGGLPFIPSSLASSDKAEAK